MSKLAIKRGIDAEQEEGDAPARTASRKTWTLMLTIVLNHRFVRFLPLAPFFCLSITYGTTFGFLAAGAPLILRARGIDLAQIGLLQLINLPIGLTFLWAGMVDRLQLPVLPHRIAWIGLMQGIAILLLCILSFGESWALADLFGLAIAIAFCVATMDVALEALVVETVAAELRPVVTSLKFAGGSLGAIIGAGILVEHYAAIGWKFAVLVVAGLNLLCLIPVLFYPERRLRRPEAIVERHAGLLGRLRHLGQHAATIGFCFAAIYALSGTNSLALLDLGLPLETVGLVTGTLSPAINIGMALTAGWLMRRFGTVPVVAAGACGVVAAASLMLLAMAGRIPELAIAATLLSMLAGGGLGVPVFSMIYRWAQGPRAATDYALLFGAAFFAAMPVRVGAPALAGKVGWPLYFGLAIPVFVTAALLLLRAIRLTESEDRSAPTAALTTR